MFQFQIYNDLSTLDNVHVFTLKTLPSRYHFGEPPGAAPIVVAAYPGWTLGPVSCNR